MENRPAAKLKFSTKIHINLIFCAILFLVMQLLQLTARATGLSDFNGVFMACQFGICLIMIRCDNRLGGILSTILMGISLFLVFFAFFVIKAPHSFAGLCNTLIYMITLIILNKLFATRAREATTDFLTGLMNRRGLYRLLERKAGNRESFHLIYINLENFKPLNDKHGHNFGDMLLLEVTRRLSEIIEKDGTLVRIGGAEFAVVLNTNRNAWATANRLLDAIREKSMLNLNDTLIECYLTPYAGISTFPTDTNNYEDLIRNADIAMYAAMRAKDMKANPFSSDMEATLNRQLELEGLIRDGLRNNYFYLVYQPQFMLNGKKLRGFESLIRMKTPDGTIISPGEFIPVAENCNLILDIDDYVLRHVMRQFKEIVTTTGTDLTISVNVSAKNIGKPNFVEKLKRILNETGFPARNLEIEITEYCLVDSVSTTIDNITELRLLGVQVALDDFGTGYTSLAYLVKMPINLLKIDKSLVDDIETNDVSRDFVRAVISMGHMIGCEVISEGVENEMQLSLLKNQSCDFVQGFVWGRPMEYADARTLVQSFVGRQASL